MVLVLLLGSSHAAVSGDIDDQGAALSQTVRGFYGWALSHGMETRRLEPHIVPMRESTRLTLDMSTLDKYCKQFMESGFFSPEFPAHLLNYYRNSSEHLQEYSQADYDEMARDGRGPLMDSEDLDVFFCSQEAQYTSSYAAGARLMNIKIGSDTANADVVTPDNWKTKFNFRKVGKQWLISGYCLYQ